MYSKTIKMATEGKINAKNAWNLPLADHMGMSGKIPQIKRRSARSLPEGVVHDRGRHEDLLFRVDDALAASLSAQWASRKARTMTRRKTTSNEKRRATQAKKARKKKEKRRGDAASTLASLDQIDAAEVDEAATDVLFSRLSRSGGGGLTDGTSARAMLLLRLAAEGACVSFGDSGVLDDGQEDAVVHVQPLRDLLPTVPTEFCPALSQLERVEARVVAEEGPEDGGASSRAPTTATTGVASTMVMRSVGIWRGRWTRR